MDTSQTSAGPALLLTIVVASSLLGLVGCQTRTPNLGIGVPVERGPVQMGTEVPNSNPVQGVDL